MKIDPKYRLPCDFVIGGVTFRKGVRLETVRSAAERWYMDAYRGPSKRNLSIVRTQKSTGREGT